MADSGTTAKVITTQTAIPQARPAAGQMRLRPGARAARCARSPSTGIGQPVVLLSHWLWNDWFGRDPGVVGQTIEVSGDMLTILGVLPQSFEFPDERTSVWIHDLITQPIQRAMGLPGRPVTAWARDSV